MDNLVIILAVVAGLAVGAAVALAMRGRSGKDDSALAQAMDQLREVTARLDTNQQILADRLGQTQSHVGERLDSLHKRLGDGFQQHTEKTGETLQQLSARLAVIDQAQKNITDLSQQMVSLQDILSNKQARGAFGEIQLNDLVTAALPPSAYAFQATLGNGRRADCMLKLPNPPGSIVIDSKFPLESFQALRSAEDEVTKVAAARVFTADVKKHIADIADKYILAGETADSALMFLPSEAIYAELHANHRNIVEESFRRRVWIVSPTTLMATLNTVRAVLKDARMKEQAGLIQVEVHKLMDDMTRLDERVGKLRTHFDQASKDIGQIETSSRKIMSRGEKIETIELGADLESPAEDLEPPSTPDPQDRLKLV